jgi:hypothetical protein
MSWYYGQVGGQVDSASRMSGVFELTGKDADGLNRLISDAGGSGKGGVWGPFNTRAEAEAARTAHSPETLTHAIDTSTPGLPIPGLTTVEGFLSTLTNSNTWLRVAEVILGLVLIAVGLAKLTNAVPVATRIAGKAAKFGGMIA